MWTGGVCWIIRFKKVVSFNPTIQSLYTCIIHLFYMVSPSDLTRVGQLFDCDFNSALDMPIPPLKHIRGRSVEDYYGVGPARTRTTVFDIDSFEELGQHRIRTDLHCYGCTAGAGSSCGGVLE